MNNGKDFTKEDIKVTPVDDIFIAECCIGQFNTLKQYYASGSTEQEAIDGIKRLLVDVIQKV